jgi:hypothetical protein
MAHLNDFDFVDIVENTAFEDRLQSWLGRSFGYARVNETRPIPPQFRAPLHGELTSEALELLESRSRLDFHLWSKIVQGRLPDRDISGLRQQTILTNVARYGVLMACSNPTSAPQSKIYSARARIRKSWGEMIRKLSVT